MSRLYSHYMAPCTCAPCWMARVQWCLAAGTVCTARMQWQHCQDTRLGMEHLPDLVSERVWAVGVHQVKVHRLRTRIQAYTRAVQVPSSCEVLGQCGDVTSLSCPAGTLVRMRMCRLQVKTSICQAVLTVY